MSKKSAFEPKIDEIVKLTKFIKEKEQERKEQIRRGLNNFNPLAIVRSPKEEVGLHSQFIYALINQNGSHFQERLFLDLFIDKVLNLKDKIQGDVRVKREDTKDKNDKRRIDFTIKSSKVLIAIEMKIDAGDQKNQIRDYYNRLKDEAKNKEVFEEEPEVYVYYLTLNGKMPSKYSLGEVSEDLYKSLKNISFKNEILEWINACQNEVRNITNLNQALEDYKRIILKLTQNYKGEVMCIVDEIAKNEDMLQTALKLDKKMNELKAKALKNFFDQMNTIFEHDGFELVNDSIEISNKRNFILDYKICKEYYKARKNREEYFGYFYKNENLPKNYLLFVMVATEHLHYGIVKVEDNKNEQKEIVKIDLCQDDKCPYVFLQCRSWKTKSLS